MYTQRQSRSPVGRLLKAFYQQNRRRYLRALRYCSATWRQLSARIQASLGCTSLLSLCAGMLYPLAFAPLSYTSAVFISILCFFSILEQQPIQSSLRHFFTISFCYAVGLFGVGVSWVFVSIYEHSPTPLWGAVLLTAIFILFLSLLFALPFSLFSQWRKSSVLIQKTALVLWWPACWILSESLRSVVFTGFPWLLVGYSLIETPLASLAPFGSVWMVSTISLLLCGWGLFFMYKPLGKRAMAGLLPFLYLIMSLILAIIFFLNILLPSSMQKIEPTVVALVQENIPQDLRWNQQAVSYIIRSYFEHSATLLSQIAPQQPTLLIWPESAMPVPLDWIQPYLDPLFEDRPFLSLITGNLLLDPEQNERAFNAVLGRGAASGVYIKEHLVPFGEYVPWASALRGLISFFELPNSDYYPAQAYSQSKTLQPFIHTPTLSLSQGICYEIAFAAQMREHVLATPAPLAILTLSNDSWFGKSWGPFQHLEIARMRALEHFRPLIRATNSGLSAIINPFGEIIRQSALEEKAELLYTFDEIPAYNTPWTTHGWLILGGWFLFYASLCCSSFYCFLRRAAPRNRRS